VKRQRPRVVADEQGTTRRNVGNSGGIHSPVFAIRKACQRQNRLGPFAIKSKFIDVPLSGFVVFAHAGGAVRGGQEVLHRLSVEDVVSGCVFDLAGKTAGGTNCAHRKTGAKPFQRRRVGNFGKRRRKLRERRIQGRAA